jgi:hypothetical protein
MSHAATERMGQERMCFGPHRVDPRASPSPWVFDDGAYGNARRMQRQPRVRR